MSTPCEASLLRIDELLTKVERASSDLPLPDPDVDAVAAPTSTVIELIYEALVAVNHHHRLFGITEPGVESRFHRLMIKVQVAVDSEAGSFNSVNCTPRCGP